VFREERKSLNNQIVEKVLPMTRGEVVSKRGWKLGLRFKSG